MKTTALFSLGLLLVSTFSLAGAEYYVSPSKDQPGDLVRELERIADSVKGLSTNELGVITAIRKDLALQAAEQIRRKLAREEEKMDELRSAVKWNHVTSKIIFLLVHLGVVLAMMAAIHEFRHGMKLRKRVRATKTSEATEPVEEFSASLEGIAIKTRLHSIMFLALAFAFYFLYLKFVYPIQFVGG